MSVPHESPNHESALSAAVEFVGLYSRRLTGDRAAILDLPVAASLLQAMLNTRDLPVQYCPAWGASLLALAALVGQQPIAVFGPLAGYVEYYLDLLSHCEAACAPPAAPGVIATADGVEYIEEPVPPLEPRTPSPLQPTAHSLTGGDA